MSWKPIIGTPHSLPQLQALIDSMPFDKWRPNGVVIHNTGAPTLKQWPVVSGEVRMRNLVHYFAEQRGWSSGPHAFVAPDVVWPFTPFNTPGTHSPSWNGTKIGIEMVGDFERESPTEGDGLRVVNNTVALVGMLSVKLGLNPDSLLIHKDDPRTTHDCPGRLFVKRDFIERVKDWMNHAGELRHEEIPPGDKAVPLTKLTNTPNDTLNVRAIPSVSGRVLTALPDHSTITVLGSEMNRSTKWLRVEAAGQSGWVSAQFTKEKKI